MGETQGSQGSHADRSSLVLCPSPPPPLTSFPRAHPCAMMCVAFFFPFFSLFFFSHRCFKILVALSTQTGALYFLRPMDPGKYVSYYETVAEPLAFAQLARRLRAAARGAAAPSGSGSKSGSGSGLGSAPSPPSSPHAFFKDAVREFAEGVRHVFLNAAGYNPPLTSPWLAGRKLSAVFERLLLDWVLDPKVTILPFPVLALLLFLYVCTSTFWGSGFGVGFWIQRGCCSLHRLVCIMSCPAAVRTRFWVFSSVHPWIGCWNRRSCYCCCRTFVLSTTAA